MTHFSLILILSFFILSHSVSAAPTKDLTPSEIVPKDVSTSENSESKPLTPNESTSEFHYPYDSGAVVNFGALAFFSSTNSPSPTGLVSLIILWASRNYFHLETGAEVVSSKDSQLWAAGRWNLNSYDRHRFFLSCGAGIRTGAQNPVAIFLPHSYYIRLAAGLESSFYKSLYSRLEFFGGLDNKAPFLLGGTIGVGVGF